MKILKVLSLAVLIIFASSCGDNLDVNVVSVSVVNDDSEVSVGEKLRIKIKGRDSDGIDYITVSIPALAINEVYDDNSGDKKWEFEEHYLVEDASLSGTYSIIVTYTDNKGNDYVETEDFSVEQ